MHYSSRLSTVVFILDNKSVKKQRGHDRNDRKVRSLYSTHYKLAYDLGVTMFIKFCPEPLLHFDNLRLPVASISV
uniref:Uncharacterized protein n=1 Tax=Rhizophora mucronata TaxID=61149 RepID=A0A2P2M9Z7_RHIMU